jgi:RNA polymerase primary sigma factor
MRQLKIIKQITNRENSSLEKYFQEIGKVDLITPDMEVELAKRIRNGDQEAFEKLIKANLRFVISVAKQYQNQGLALADLINEGNLGLMKAAKRFDETRGFKFISYAVWWIRQSILKALAEQSRIIRLPLNKIGIIGKINKMQTFLEQENERPPSTEEISEKLNITSGEVKKCIDSSEKFLSLDAPFNENEEYNLYDVLNSDNLSNPEKELLHESLKTEIQRCLQTLKPREANIVQSYYGLGEFQAMSLSEIGENLNLTRERVRQIKEKSIRRLKKTSRNKLLKMYLG